MKLSVPVASDEEVVPDSGLDEAYLSIGAVVSQYAISQSLLHRAVRLGQVRVRRHVHGLQVLVSDVARLLADHQSSPPVAPAPSRRGPRRIAQANLQATIWQLVTSHGELSVAQVMALLPAANRPSYFSVANHLRLLHQQGLLTRHKRGRWFVYAAIPSAGATTPEPTAPTAPAPEIRRVRTKVQPPPDYTPDPELETAILAALAGAGRTNLAQLHDQLLTSFRASYPQMLAAVRSLVFRRRIARWNSASGYLYAIAEDGSQP